MNEPSLLTIIVNYRTAPMTIRATEAALRAMEGIRGSITIIDNDSQDGSYAHLTGEVTARGWDRDGRVRVLQSGHNGGFGAGVNFAIRAGLPDCSTPDYVYLLNSDAFPAPDAVRRLLDHLEAHPQAGLAGSYLHGPEGEPHQTAFRFPGILSEFEGGARTGPISRLLERYRVAMPIPDRAGPVDWTAGASLMIRRRMLDETGLFDEGYFLYYDEVDLCLRARRRGWQTHYVPESRVMHLGSVSTGMKAWDRVPRYWFDSRLRYFVKSHGIVHATSATAALIAGTLLWRARALAGRRPHGGPERFLRDLIAHAAACAWRGLTIRRRGGSFTGRAATGEGGEPE